MKPLTIGIVQDGMLEGFIAGSGKSKIQQIIFSVTEEPGTIQVFSDAPEGQKSRREPLLPEISVIVGHPISVTFSNPISLTPNSRILIAATGAVHFAIYGT